jgi:hypothetical protein
MRRVLITVALCALAATLPAAAQNFTPLPNNETLTFNLPGGNFTTELVVDVPEGARRLTVEVDSTTAGVDIDLLLRHGAPFRFDVPDLDGFLDQSQYNSISPGASEQVAISDANHFPLRAGRWYLNIINLSGEAASVQVRAVVSNDPPATVAIEVDYNQPGENCNVSEWNSQRRAALDSAVQRISQTLSSTVPVRIRACWRDYGDESTTLASASPSGFFRGFPASPRRNTFFSRPTVARQAGTPLCKLVGGSCTATDLTITFNTRIDDPSRAANQRWHYGTSDDVTVTGFDFVTVAMHEIVHGLGFVGLVRTTTGELLGAPFDDIYSFNTLYAKLGEPVRRLTELDSDAERLEALTSGIRLSFDALAELAPITQPGRLTPLPLHAPSEVASGSTLSHFRAGIDPPQLMFPGTPSGQMRRTLGFSELVLNKVGWDPEPKAAPAFAAPLVGQWFDPARNGHGIEFSRVGNTWVFTMYTYDEAGHPEYYQTIGPLVDGVFVPLTQNFTREDGSTNTNSLLRFFYDETRSPPQFPDPSADFIGRLGIDFVDPDTYPECRDELTATRPTEDGLAVMRWRIDSNQTRFWCMTPLLPAATRSGPDFTGLWYAGDDDSGWGFSVTNASIGDRELMIAILYYPDAEGRGRWAFAFTDDYQPGQTIPLRQRIAYCRTCPFPAGDQPWTDRIVGEITLNLVQPALFNPAAGNSASFWLEVPDGPSAGRFERDTFNMLMLTEPVEP